MWKDAIEMREAVRNQEVSPIELVQESLEKIQAFNPELNAVVQIQAETALKEANERSFVSRPL